MFFLTLYHNFPNPCHKTGQTYFMADEKQPISRKESYPFAQSSSRLNEKKGQTYFLI